ncbi:uncharacterized protein [Aristolochia californica]|uniref:uncharacterized protein isoform X2 n=1 Tax=Aristolochia californica TaxID=171875 RepID=UPI0035D60ED1
MRNITFTLGGDEGRFCGAIQWLLFSLSFGAETIWIWWVFAGRFGIYDSGASTVFLIRALQQLGMMFDPVHVYATAIYIISVTFALVCALLRCSFLQIHSKILTILAVIEEICTLIWCCGLSNLFPHEDFGKIPRFENPDTSPRVVHAKASPFKKI